MADTEAINVTVSDHQAHSDELAQKKAEEMQATKQDDITPSRDAEKTGDIEKPKFESNAGIEASDTKLEELPNNKQPEPSAKTEAEKDQIKGPPEAESTGQEIRHLVVNNCGSEFQELTGKAAERNMEEAIVTDEATKDSGEELATKAVQKITEEKTPIKEVAKEPMEISADAMIEKVPEKTPAVETIEKLPEDKLVSQGVKIVAEVNSTVETVQDAKEEKPPNDSISKDKSVEAESAEKQRIEQVESLHDKVATEAMEKVTEEKTPIQEAATKELMEILTDARTTKELENTSAVEVIERVPQDKPGSEEVKNVLEEKPAAEVVKIVTREMPTAEAVESSNVEKTKDQANESITTENPEVKSGGNAEESKADTEAISTMVEKETGSAPAEKRTTESIEFIQDGPAAVEKVEHATEEKLTVGGETQNQPAIEVVNKPESEMVSKKNSAQPGETLEIKEQRTPEESKDNLVLSQEKVDTSLEPMVVKSSSAATQEVQPDQKAEEKPAASEADKAPTDFTTKEAAVADVSEQSLKNETKLPEKVDERKEDNDQIEEDKEKKTFKLGDLMQEDINELENDGSSETTSKVVEKSLEGEQASRYTEVNNEKAANIEEAAPTSAETCKDNDDGKKAQSEVTTGEKVEADANKPETEKESNDEMKSDNNINQESAKNVDNAKESQDLSTKKVSGKPAHKQSNNILSKVKKSIVKVKKALVGKSPSSRNISTEA